MPKRRRPAEDPSLEIAARHLAAEMARAEYGEGGFCFQTSRIADSRIFRCYIAHHPATAGEMVGKTVTVKVPG